MQTPSVSERARMARLQAMDRAQAVQREREQEREQTKLLRQSYQRQLRRNEELRNRIGELEKLLDERQAPPEEGAETHIDEMNTELDVPSGTDSSEA